MQGHRGVIVPVLALMLGATTLPAAGERTREQQLEARRQQLHDKWERQFRAADVDGSRDLTPAELEAGGLPRSLLRRFAEIDTNGDGALDPDELLAAQDQRLRSGGGEAAGTPGK